jgi:hypothetical protein
MLRTAIINLRRSETLKTISEDEAVPVRVCQVGRCGQCVGPNCGSCLIRRKDSQSSFYLNADSDTWANQASPYGPTNKLTDVLQSCLQNRDKAFFTGCLSVGPHKIFNHA